MVVVVVVVVMVSQPSSNTTSYRAAWRGREREREREGSEVKKCIINSVFSALLFVTKFNNVASLSAVPFFFHFASETYQRPVGRDHPYAVRMWMF
jgi:hypothetical protein